MHPYPDQVCCPKDVQYLEIMKPSRLSFIALFLVLGAASVQAQGTFADIHALMQGSCVTSCHGGSSPSAGLDLSQTPSDVYADLVNVAPANSTAASKGYKLIDPNYPENSYLLQKLGADGFDAGYGLESGEGDRMPKSGAAWAAEDIELVRQWILYGAYPVDEVVDHSLLADFYGGMGMKRIERPEGPAEGEGFQMHHGPIFLAPGQEIEVLRRYKEVLGMPVDVKRLGAAMSEESHHFILYKYDDDQDASDGIRLVDDFLDLGDLTLGSSQLGTWQYDLEHELPYGTAYQWGDDPVFDLNFHVRNYDDDSILAAEVYINIWTEASSFDNEPMLAELELYGDFFPWLLFIPDNPNPTVRVMEQFETGSTDTLHIWLLQAHTHQLGIDYDIYLRNPDGSRGEQIYEGFYNEDYTFNQGFYDYEHPPLRRFETLLKVPLADGLIHEATYLNNTGTDVGFGLTTEDEMFITYYHYTLNQPEEEPSTGIATTSIADLRVGPNPFGNQLNLQISLQESAQVQFLLFDLSGRQVDVLWDASFPAGSWQHSLPVTDLEAGMYLGQWLINGQLSGGHKLMHIK